MYKISFALASVLALADALHLKTSCNPCCDGGHDQELDDETLEVIGDVVVELTTEDDEADDASVDPACANRAAELMSISGWDQLEVLTFDKMN